MKKVLILFAIILAGVLNSCQRNDSFDLYSGFVNPPAEARPFVRWWWNGNRITENEIKRQIEVLHSAGIGGVEINPIAFPEWSDSLGIRSLTWLSPEWNRLVALASEEAGKRGMITDLIVGSGWPFGGEFINEDESVQRVITNSIKCNGGDRIRETGESLLQKALTAQSRAAEGEAFSNSLLFIRLVPEGAQNTVVVTDLISLIDSEGDLDYTVPSGSYYLVYGFVQKGHRQVLHGAPGAAGPVMDHYRRDITLAYLNRLKKISEDTGIPLNKLIRALFCDSIELAGANWTDGFEEIFLKTYGYDLKPWFPFIFYESYRGYSDEKLSEDFSDQLKRVRYDYNKLLVRVFLDNFTQAFQDFCTENGLLCRYQAYGTPFLMGMMEGNMIPDIPESNNWIYSVDMETDEWIWNQDHGYMIWNLYAASGGHLTGRKIISCEAMTNTRGVFKASLEEIKRHDDMNFITGINHTILHGYNYSPVEAGFPGWIRYGAYFSEQNTWWPYFRKWTDYNSRLSYIFQNSKPVKNIAIVGPTGDVWSDRGLIRVPFHKEPWYCYRLWEPLSQSGSSCDYIDEKIIRDAKKEKGLINYGPMSYQAMILCNFRSMEPQTAEAVAEYVESGGKVVLTGSVPGRSLSYPNSGANDNIVKKIFDDLLVKYPDRIFRVEEPENQAELLSWTQDILGKLKIIKDLEIDNPCKDLFQIRHVDGNRDIWFFVNSNRSETIKISAEFPTGNKTPWIWNPEDGSREIFPYQKNRNDLSVELQPLQSILLVFDPGLKGDKPEPAGKPDESVSLDIMGPWKAEFRHINGQVFERTFERLEEFGTSDDHDLNSFAGAVNFSTTFNSDGTGKWLELEKVNKGVTEVFLNGRQAGTRWYGKPVFRIDSLVKNGDNRLEIKYVSVLSNYVRTLKDNPTAVQWTKGYEKIPAGIEGPVTITR